MEKDAVVISGYLKFKAGLLNKWSTGFCQICKDLFTVHRSEDDYSEPLYRFSSQNSWVSAKTGTDTGLFALNAKISSDSPSKTFLFDAVLYEELQAWLQGFMIGGWGSAVVDKKLHYHRRSIDNGLGTQGKEAERSAIEVFQDHRNEAIDRNEAADGNEVIDRSENEIIGRNDIEAAVSMNNAVNRGNAVETEHALLCEEFPAEESERLGQFFDINGNKCITECNQSNAENDKPTGRYLHSRYSDLTKFQDKANELSYKSDNIGRNNNIRRCASQPVRIRRHGQEARFDHSKIFFDPTKSSNIEHELDFKQVKSTNNRIRKSSLSKKPASSPLLEREESSVSNDELFSSVPNCVTHEPIDSPSELQSDGASSVNSGQTKNENSSLLTMLCPNLVRSNDASSNNSELMKNETSSESFVQPKNQAQSDFLFGSSEVNQSVKLPSTSAGSHERERYLTTDVPRARKSSSVASEGVADLNVDIDNEVSVFTSASHGGHLSYLESGYCSKESLATSESLDSPKSPVLSLNELKIADSGNEEKRKESMNRDQGTSEHNDFLDSNGNKSDKNEVPTIAVTGRAYSDSKMTPKLARPSFMKMEKRSSMSQLLSQIKGKLPGRKPKTSRKSIKRGQINFENSESVLWRSNESWKERWISVHGSCLLLFKDSSVKSPDLALDIREYTLQASTEIVDGHYCAKLVDKNGKDHSFAAVTEESFKGLMNILKGITSNGTLSDSMALSDSRSTDDVDEPDSEEIDFQNAIVPYSESDTYHEVTDSKPSNKQMSVDSGNDGDVSCFEASDASTVGIDVIASERKEKIERRRKTSILLQRQQVQEIENETIMSDNEPKTQISHLQRHKKVTYAESSPPTPTRKKEFPFNVPVTNKSDTALYQAPEYLNVEIPRKLKSNRYSVPDFRKNSQQMLRHRSSCLEEVMKLKEAHENNKYPEKARKIDRNRSTSWYIPIKRNQDHVTDENDNHQPVGSWDGLVTSSPMKSGSVSETQNKLKERLELSNNGNELREDFEEDLKQQTLLMKRRNSLRIRKEVVWKKVKQIKESLDKNKYESDSTESMNHERHLSTLEESLSDINNEIDSLNERISAPAIENSKDAKKSKQLFYKLKNSSKSSQNNKGMLTKETMDTLLTSPGLSPRLRKRSFTQNLKNFSNSLKRNSESSEPNSNRESMSSMDSSNDLLADVNDAEFVETSKDHASQERMASSPIPLVVDEIDGRRSNYKSSYEGGISKDALLEIEEFEKFAVQIAAKSFTECIDV